MDRIGGTIDTSLSILTPQDPKKGPQLAATGTQCSACVVRLYVQPEAGDHRRAGSQERDLIEGAATQVQVAVAGSELWDWSVPELPPKW